MNLATPEHGLQSIAEQIPLGGQIQWFFASDDAVDLAILPLAPDSKRYAYRHIPFSIVASSDQLKNGDVAVGDQLVFAGYFSSFSGQTRMEPIVREGVIAMLPEEKLDTTLHKKGKLFLADLHAFRGVSTTLRHILTEFSEFFHVSWTGLLMQASVGTAGGLGALRTKRSG